VVPQGQESSHSEEPWLEIRGNVSTSARGGDCRETR
jgi:hypothetical protein